MMKVTTHNSVLSGAARRAFLRATVTAAALISTAIPTFASIQDETEGGGLGSLFVNYYGFTILFVVLLVGFLIYRKKKSPSAPDMLAKTPARTVVNSQESPSANQTNRKLAPQALPGDNDRQPRSNAAPQRDSITPDDEHSAFGAYRIDQEVGKLVLGKSHRMDVMASRIADDRRAIEASLIKALSAPDTEPDGRERARGALEEYGFVARLSALVITGRDAWERSSAARVLGQIASPASLPSLIEALHDTDSVVRNQAVTSLGQLKQPAAIGALLDIARRHSDIPPSILSESLSACSVDSLGYLDAAPFDFTPSEGGAEGDIQDLAPLAFEKLPMGDDDDALLTLFTRLESADSKERALVARELASHRSERSVAALCATALNDPDASVRSAAVAGLGAIDHESVFATVLIACADETREVRAAAARTLSSLHIDRGDAYARVAENNDEKTLQDVAKA
ncbi:MAG: HEAT repeat domain-containing protein, partial [Pyrinomonadaceae bacterium]